MSPYNQGVRAVRRRWLVSLLVTAVVVAGLAGLPAVRRPVLRALGRVLVFNDATGPADVIVVASDAFGCGVLEAADLVRGGVASRVAVFAALPDPAAREFIRRGVPYEDAAAGAVRQLRALGVETIEIIPTAVTGTEDEGRVLPPWCDRNGFRSVLLVADADHTRRLRRVLRRSFKGHGTTVAVRATRYSEFDPDHWWETRAGVRIGIVEMEKLLLDVVRHPIS
jgi:hypothetical protein